MPTIRDVARLAGVAPITVSRVINHSGYFSDDTRQHVEAAINQLGYVPNTLARSLRSRHTNTLALVLTDITNPFWTTVTRGVEDAASDAGFNVILCNTDESEAEQEKYLNVLLQKRVDGILLVPVGCTPEPVYLIQKQDVTVVILDRRVPGIQVDTVRCDSEDGGYQLTRLLLSLGHRQIAMLSGPVGVSTAEDRVDGYCRALVESGLPVDAGNIFHGEFTQQGGYHMAQQALAISPRPTAFAAGNNFIAIGALQAVRQAGLQVPEDLALVGFDDLPAALLVDPFFTVVAQPAYEMGKQATELLLARIAGQVEPASREIILPVEVVIRRSSGAYVKNLAAA
jgi:LacI family transcriptional regulator